MYIKLKADPGDTAKDLIDVACRISTILHIPIKFKMNQWSVTCTETELIVWNDERVKAGYWNDLEEHFQMEPL